MKLESITFALAAITATIGVATAADSACVSSEECDSKRKDLGIQDFYKYEDAPTKGCFQKNNKAFFVNGTIEEMSDPNVAGITERIWCDGEESDDGDTVSSPAAAASADSSSSGVTGLSSFIIGVAAATTAIAVPHLL